MAKMTPLQQALNALDRDLPRSGLPEAAQLEYDRIKPVWEDGTPAEVKQLRWEAKTRYPFPSEPEPDASGVPVQEWPPDAITYLALAGLICGIVPLVLAITHLTHKPTVHQIVLGLVCSGLAYVLPFTFFAKRPEKLPALAMLIAFAGMFIGLFGMIFLAKAAGWWNGVGSVPVG